MTDMSDWFYVHPCGHKLDLTYRDEPVAAFQHSHQAIEFGLRWWPQTFEVREHGKVVAPK